MSESARDQLKAHQEPTLGRKMEIVEALLGPPSYRGPGVALYHGDCITLMRKLSQPIIDLTVTSPPYNIGKEYETPVAIEEYLGWSERWIDEVNYLTEPGGAFWLNLGYFTVPDKARAMPIAYLLWPRVKFYLIQEIVWNYGAGVAGRLTFSPRNEKFLWYVKDPAKYTFNLDAVRDPNVKYPHQKKNGKLKCNPLGKNPSDVWQIPKVTSGANRSSKERTPHPAQFPMAVVNRIIQACSNPGDLVFDPFIGSGSTAEAALQSGRSVVGFELNKQYLNVAATRLDLYFERKHRERNQISLL